MVVEIIQNAEVEDNIKGYISEFAYDVNGNIEYVGKAVPGSLTSESVWFIKKFIYNTNGDLLRILKANGLNTFSNVFDNRALIAFS